MNSRTSGRLCRDERSNSRTSTYIFICYAVGATSLVSGHTIKYGCYFLAMKHYGAILVASDYGLTPFPLDNSSYTRALFCLLIPVCPNTNLRDARTTRDVLRKRHFQWYHPLTLFFETLLTMSLQPLHSGFVQLECASNPGLGSTCRPRTSNDRNKFFLFIKIFLKYIEKTKLVSIRHRAKAIITDCTYRNRLGDPDCTPLQDAINFKLRILVGEIHWCRVQRCYDAYCRKQFWKIPQPKVTEAV